MPKAGQNLWHLMMQERKLINHIKMGDIEFVFTPYSTSDSEEYGSMRRKHMQESSVYSNDSFNITQIFGFISNFYKNISSENKNTLKNKNEEEITDSICKNIRENEDFQYSGFTVNIDARNQSHKVGYYDLKFENPAYWQGKYFVFECKPINLTAYRIREYLYKNTTTKKDGGLYRFLINKYAENLPFGGMLGYVISDTPEEVMTKLKTKIKSFQITEDEMLFGNLIDEHLLNMHIPDFNHSFQSKHRRINQNKEIITPIHIFHLFLDLTK
jgi:hypothetical protein